MNAERAGGFPQTGQGIAGRWRSSADRAVSDRRLIAARRMFVYFARLHEKYGLPIVPIALFSYDAPKTPEPSVYEIALPSGETVVRFA